MGSKIPGTCYSRKKKAPARKPANSRPEWGSTPRWSIHQNPIQVLIKKILFLKVNFGHGSSCQWELVPGVDDRGAPILPPNFGQGGEGGWRCHRLSPETGLHLVPRGPTRSRWSYLVFLHLTKPRLKSLRRAGLTGSHLVQTRK